LEEEKGHRMIGFVESRPVLVLARVQMPRLGLGKWRSSEGKLRKTEEDGRLYQSRVGSVRSKGSIGRAE